MVFFTSNKEIDRLRQEISRLLGKGMSNIYLKLTKKTDFLKTSNFQV